MYTRKSFAYYIELLTLVLNGDKEEILETVPRFVNVEMNKDSIKGVSED